MVCSQLGTIYHEHLRDSQNRSQRLMGEVRSGRGKGKSRSAGPVMPLNRSAPRKADCTSVPLPCGPSRHAAVFDKLPGRAETTTGLRSDTAGAVLVTSAGPQHSQAKSRL